MDADLQHDPRILPEMLKALQGGEYNLAIASRYMEGGGTGEWSKGRRQYSRLATTASHFVTHQTKITDPMSGFFMIKRELFRKAVYRLCGKGFKIFLDILSTARGRGRSHEIPYTFRNRLAGESKLRYRSSWNSLSCSSTKALGALFLTDSFCLSWWVARERFCISRFWEPCL